MEMTGTKAIAQRIVNAEENFAEVLMNIANISKADAFKAMTTLRKLKMVKVDPVGGRMIVKHGSYIEADVIRRAVNF
jgi:hypothetical protein